jgi:hypothetical protein
MQITFKVLVKNKNFHTYCEKGRHITLMLDTSLELPPFLTEEHIAGVPDAPCVQTTLGSSTDNAKGHATSAVKFSGKLFGHTCLVSSLNNPPSAQFAK